MEKIIRHERKWTTKTEKSQHID